MSPENRIILDLFPPTEWTEEGIRTALSIQETADAEDGMAWLFTQGEIDFLAQCIMHYIDMPRSNWGESFTVDEDIIFDDPKEHGRFIIDMAFPEHLEPPARLR